MNDKVGATQTLTTGKKTEKKIEFPHVLVLIFAVIIIAAVATYIIPAGQYARVVDKATGRSLIDPASFKYIKSTPVGPFAVLLSIVEGLIQASNITFLIFMAFASLYLIERTGTLDASIALMVNKTKSNPGSAKVILAVIMVIFAVWASTGTFSYEEITAFIPIFATLSIALGYDPLVGLGISLIPVGMGFSSATLNPFTIGVAQGIAELPLFSGIGLRIAVLIVMTSLTVCYVLWYADRIKKDPSKSLVADIDFGEFIIDEERMATKLTKERKLTLAILIIGILAMIYGLVKLKWYINQIAAVFLGVAVASGLVNRWSLNKIANTFVEGLSKGVLSALVVGFARGILIVVDKGHILDTIIHSAASILSSLGLYASGFGMFVFQTILNFLIPSGSGQAATAMPIMAPLADLIGMKRQIAVLIFQFGDGYSDLLWPTGFLLIACALAKVPLNKYYKWVFPLFGISFAVQMIFIVIAINIGYGPF